MVPIYDKVQWKSALLMEWNENWSFINRFDLFCWTLLKPSWQSLNRQTFKKTHFPSWLSDWSILAQRSGLSISKWSYHSIGKSTLTYFPLSTVTNFDLSLDPPCLSRALHPKYAWILRFVWAYEGRGGSSLLCLNRRVGGMGLISQSSLPDFGTNLPKPSNIAWWAVHALLDW